MIFYTYQLTYLEVRGLSYLSVIYQLSNPILHEQFGMDLPQFPQILHCYLPGLVTNVSTIVLQITESTF